jgi:hypothetical protein
MSAAGRLEARFYVPAGATVTATAGGSGPTTVYLTEGWYWPSTFLTHLVTRLTIDRPPSSGAWSATVSTGLGGTGLVTLNCTDSDPEGWSLTFTTPEAGTVIGFTGNIAPRSSAATGTQNARGLWLPNCHIDMDTHPATMPEVTDARAVSSGTGRSVVLVGVAKFRHPRVAWRYVIDARTHATSETTTYASWQSWLRDTQLGRGHAWFRPGSRFQAYYDSGAGADLPIGGAAAPLLGWHFEPAIASHAPRMASGQWVGLWTIETPSIVAGDD